MNAQSVDTASDGPFGSPEVSDSATSGISIDRWKRLGSVALGGALLTVGLRRRSLSGAAMALAGGWVTYRAVSGRDRSSQAPESSSAVDRDRRGSETAADSPTVERSITIGKSADELSEFLYDPEHLGRIAGHFAEVASAGEDRHRWTVRGPLGRTLSWEMQLAEDRSGEFLRWESVGTALVPNEWSVSFRSAPGDRGTETTLRVRVDPPGGSLGRAATKRLDIVFDALVGKALDRFKSLAETGEIPTLERNSSARGNGDLI